METAYQYKISMNEFLLKWFRNANFYPYSEREIFLLGIGKRYG
jgi:hypothetical protein